MGMERRAERKDEEGTYDRRRSEEAEGRSQRLSGQG